MTMEKEILRRLVDALCECSLEKEAIIWLEHGALAAAAFELNQLQREADYLSREEIGARRRSWPKILAVLHAIKDRFEV